MTIIPEFPAAPPSISTTSSDFSLGSPQSTLHGNQETSLAASQFAQHATYDKMPGSSMHEVEQS